MSEQDEYNREVVQNARRLVAAAGLDKLPLVMALRQIAFAFETAGPEQTLQMIDAMRAKADQMPFA